jgi:hypothetical protein
MGKWAGGKLAAALGELRAQAEGWLEKGIPFASPWCWEVWRHWLAWKRGWPPHPDVRTVGELPWGLSEAFTALDIVEHVAMLKRSGF